MNDVLVGKKLVPDRFDAAVLDLDGVVTRTARVHAAAWKQMFDDFLAAHHPDQAPFAIASDYPDYVDGMPRLDGVRSFLASRGIELPEGEPDDGPERGTVHGLGSRKNRVFREKLERDGVEVYESSVALLRGLRERGIATAVVSSSRNCAAVVEAAGLAELFDARVDGRELARLGLAGKPAPDMFLEATRRLAVDPQRAVGFEDAAAGVQAARAAGLACVVGIDRRGHADKLRAAGADLVVEDLCELNLAESTGPAAKALNLPSALDHLDDMVPPADRELAIFLDYDGTLTPIVSRPEDAVLDSTMRSTLERLARVCALAIVSGRDLPDVRDRVGIDGLWYAGSHGFDIEGPAGERMELEKSTEFLPALDAAEQALAPPLQAITGCQVERKRFAIAVHYRRVAEADVPEVRRRVEEAHQTHPELRLSTGKMIFELQPDIDWHKGRALRWLMETLEMEPPRFVPVYLGDDQTDEDAFIEIAPCGIGIVVADDDQATRARYRLPGPDAAEEFLGRLADRITNRLDKG